MSVLDDIRDREVERRRKAALALRDLMREAAPRLGGRFILYGSAARDDLRADSDIDVLLDFPLERQAEAYRVLEEASSSLAIKIDILPRAVVSNRFFEHIMKDAEVFS